MKNKTADPFEAWLKEAAAFHKQAAKAGTWDGKQITEYYSDCRKQHIQHGVTIVLTRDVGYHASGRFTQAALDQCWNLSIASFNVANLMPQTNHKQKCGRIVAEFLWPNAKQCWVEPPARKGTSGDIVHFLLFCDHRWLPVKLEDNAMQELRSSGLLPFLEYLKA